VSEDEETKGAADQHHSFDWEAQRGERMTEGRTPRRPREVDQHLVSLLAPTRFEAEQYQMLRHAVERRHQEGIRSIAVTSPGPEDGKTTTVLNLAGTLAQSRLVRVLLIDADLRRPALLQRLGLVDQARPGLIQAVTERIQPSELIQRGPRINVSLLSSGGISRTPYEVLKSPVLADLLARFRVEYDYVIVDTPPVVTCPDFQLVENCCDASLLVVRAHRTPRHLIQSAVAALDLKKAMGLVFNDDSDHMNRMYYQRYYGAQE
jgi:capsular exopolysaccharide synthesis family protein